MDTDNHNTSPNSDLIEDLEKYKLLTGSIPVSLFISTCLAVIMATVLDDQVNYGTLLSWLIILVSLHIIRLLVFYQFNRSVSIDHQQIQLHLQFFRFGTLMSGLIWGWAGFFFSQQVELPIVYHLHSGRSGGGCDFIACHRQSGCGQFYYGNHITQQPPLLHCWQWD